VSDTQLERAVMVALGDNHRVHADEIAVEATGGEVIVRGTVGSPLQRDEAVRTARCVPGVRGVEERLHVRPLGIDGRVDADTEAAVIAALIDDGEVPAAGIDVDAHGDTVTLSGLVDVAAQRDRAERVALRVGGVAHVRNELRVFLNVSADEVAERVTNAIGVDAIVGADRIRVVVRDNDVTLSGSVGSAEHRVAALEAAAAAPGVLGVHDELTVRVSGERSSKTQAAS
jgi:hyperosmotically inducible protein